MSVAGRNALASKRSRVSVVEYVDELVVGKGVSADRSSDARRDSRGCKHSRLECGGGQIFGDRIDLRANQVDVYGLPSAHSARILGSDSGDRRRSENAESLECLEIG